MAPVGTLNKRRNSGRTYYRLQPGKHNGRVYSSCPIHNCLLLGRRTIHTKPYRAFSNKKHLKNVGPIRHCAPPHALILHCHSPGVAYCRMPPAHRCPRQRRQRQRVTEGTAMAPWNGPNKTPGCFQRLYVDRPTLRGLHYKDTVR